MNVLLYFISIIILFPAIYILGFAIWIDLLLWILLIFLLRNKIQIYLTCSLIITLAFIINFIPVHEKEIYWRPHEKFAEKFSYQKNINITMKMEHGDLYKLDDAINSKKEFIKQSRKINLLLEYLFFCTRLLKNKMIRLKV